MAEYEVTDRETGDTYVIDGPDDATDEEIMAAMTGKARERPGFFSPETAEGLFMSAGQGASLGFAEEAGAGIQAGLLAATGYTPGKGFFDYGTPVGELYGNILGKARGRLKQFREDQPEAAFAAELAGTAPLALASGGSGAVIREGGKLAGNIGRSAAASGAFGGVYGFGAGEGAEGRLESGETGAAVGAALGAAAPPVVAGIGGAYKFVADRLRSLFGGSGAQASIAARKVVQAIQRDNPGMSAEEALATARRNLEEIGPEAVLADTGENVRGLTGSMARAPGEGKARITQEITERQTGARHPETRELGSGQYSRVSQLLDDLVPEDSLAARATLSKPTEAGSKFYASAYAANQSVDSPLVRRILKTPEGAKALKLAAREAQNRMSQVATPDPELTAIAAELRELGLMGPETATGAGIARGLKLQTLDMVKRELDAIWRAGRGATGAKAAQIRKAAKNAGDLARSLRNELDRLDITARAGPKSFKAEGGDYARARAAEQTRLRAKDALKSGESFIRSAQYRNPKELQAALSEMSNEERHAFRISAAGELKRMIGDVPITADVTKRLMNRPNLERKILLAFGDKETFSKYIRGLESEAKMFETYAEITGNSATARRLAEEADAGIDPAPVLQAAADFTRGQWLSALRSLARGTIQGAKGRLTAPEPVRNEIAQFLMSRETGALTEGVEAARLSEEAKRYLARALLSAEQAGAPARSR